MGFRKRKVSILIQFNRNLKMKRKDCLFLISDQDEHILPFYERWMNMSIHIRRKN